MNFEEKGRIRAHLEDKLFSAIKKAGLLEAGLLGNRESEESEQTTKNKHTEKDQRAGGQKAPEVETSQPPDHPPQQQTDSLECRAEKLDLEQSMAKVVGSPTGLFMLLDAMVYDTKEKNPVGFRGHAEGYFWRLGQLQSYLERYQKIAQQEDLESMPLYRKLLDEGDILREMLNASEGPSDEELDRWRENMLQRINLYGDKEEGDHEQ